MMMEQSEYNKKVEDDFLNVAKELSAMTKNPRWAMKARQSINDMKDIYRHASDPDEIVAYKTAEIKYKKLIDYEVGR